jgi:hypothetical protein
MSHRLTGTVTTNATVSSGLQHRAVPMTMRSTSPIAQPVRQCSVAEIALRVRALPSIADGSSWSTPAAS